MPTRVDGNIDLRNGLAEEEDDDDDEDEERMELTTEVEDEGKR